MIVFLETQDCLLIPIKKKSMILLVSYVLCCLKTITEGSWIFLVFFFFLLKRLTEL